MRILRGAVLVFAIAVAGCADDSESPQGADLHLTIARGNAQNAAVGSFTSVAPAVKVTDAGGNAVPGVAVKFDVLSGASEVVGGNQVTGQDGIAAVDGWKMGSTAGVKTITAVVQNATPLSVTFTATAFATTAGYDRR